MGHLLLPKRSGHESGRRILIPALRKNLRSGRVQRNAGGCLHSTSGRNQKTDDALSECSRKLAKCLSDSAEDLVAAKEQLEQLSGNFDVRRLAACTKSKKETFYILCGWMSEKMPLPSRRTSKMTQISSASSRMMQQRSASAADKAEKSENLPSV